MFTAFFRSRRFRAAGIHVLGSSGFAFLAALIVFLVWYPPPLSQMAGGLSLLMLLVGVDVVLGPVLTLVAASPDKPLKELRRDLAMIVLLQLAAFGYGMHAIAVARPVLMAFEVDRFRVVTAVDIDASLLPEAPPQLRALSWSGPRVIATVKPTAPDEVLWTIDLGLSGVELSMLPRYWRSYASQVEAVWQAARPLPLLLARYPQAAVAAQSVASHAGIAVGELRFLPLQSRRESWTLLIAAPDARIVGHLPVDAFF